MSSVPPALKMLVVAPLLLTPLGGVEGADRTNAEARLDRTQELRLEMLTTDTVGPELSPRSVAPPAAYFLYSDAAALDQIGLGEGLFEDGYPLLHTVGDFEDGNTALGIDSLTRTTPGPRFSSEGKFNSALGQFALQANTIGRWNTAVGHSAMRYGEDELGSTAVGFRALRESHSSFNTAVGSQALSSNTTGFGNAALGYWAGARNTEGGSNTAVGGYAGWSNTTGDLNTTVGALSGGYNETGSWNTSIGAWSLHDNENGNSNVAVGHRAGEKSTGSHNVLIKNRGVAGESGVIRIGDSHIGAVYFEGINNVPIGTGAAVVINASGRLGTMASSRRFKEAIEPMAALSNDLEGLRPVTFRYRPEISDDAPRPLEYGLIAEEVAEILPDLVVYDDQGMPLSVRYHLLTPMLLKEIQVQRRELDELRERLLHLETRTAAPGSP